MDQIIATILMFLSITGAFSVDQPKRITASIYNATDVNAELVVPYGFVLVDNPIKHGTALVTQSVTLDWVIVPTKAATRYKKLPLTLKANGSSYTQEIMVTGRTLLYLPFYSSGRS